MKFPRESETEHVPQPDRHVGVAREVEVDLKGVGRHPDPRQVPGRSVCREDHVGDDTDVVGNEQLLGKADDEVLEAQAELVNGVGSFPELLGDLVVADDRAGDQLGEQ